VRGVDLDGDDFELRRQAEKKLHRLSQAAGSAVPAAGTLNP
jgi:hypothetical protein